MDQGGKITVNHKWKSCRHGNRLRFREIINIKQKEIGINVTLVCCVCLRRPTANFDLITCGEPTYRALSSSTGCKVACCVPTVHTWRHVHPVLTYLTRYPHITLTFRAHFTGKSRGRKVIRVI